MYSWSGLTYRRERGLDVMSRTTHVQPIKTNGRVHCAHKTSSPAPSAEGGVGHLSIGRGFDREYEHVP